MQERNEIFISMAMEHVANAAEYMREKKFDFAISEYDKAIKYDPHNPYLYFERALAFDNMGHGMEALKDYDKFLSITDKLPSERVYKEYIKYKKEQTFISSNHLLADISKLNNSLREAVLIRKQMLSKKSI